MNKQIRITIGICSSNDEKTIGTLLKNLTMNYYSFKNRLLIDEIIIVSSGCTDRTENIIESFNSETEVKISLIREKKRTGKSSALNIILNKYNGDILILIPADTNVTLKSVNRLVKTLIDNPKIGVISGKPIIKHYHKKCTIVCKMAATLWDLHNLNMELLDIKHNSHATGELMALRRGIIKFIPPEIVNDDAFIALVAKQLDWLIGFEHRAIVNITVPTTLNDYFIQRKRIIFGHKQLLALRRNQTTTIKSLFLHHPIYSLKVLSKVITTPRKVLTIMLAMVIEFGLEVIVSLNRKNINSFQHVWRRINVDLLP